MLQAPVMTAAGQGVIGGRHRLAREHARRQLWGEADVVLAVGTRLQPQPLSWGIDDDAEDHPDGYRQEEVGRKHRPEIGIVGDAAAKLGLAAGWASTPPSATAARGRRDEAGRDQGAARQAGAAGAYLEAIRAALPEDGILVDELTQIGYVARLAFPVYKPRAFLRGYQGTLGYGYATALGAKVASPTRR